MAGTVKGRPHHPMRVVPHRPGLRVLTVLAALAVLVASAVASYWYGDQQAARELAGARLQLADFQRRAVQAESELSELRERLAFDERTRQLDEQAAENAQQLVSDLREQLSVSERDNTLYRQVMGLADQSPPELMVFRWQVMPTDAPGYYVYELDVAMAGTGGESSDVLLEIDLLGRQGGQAAELRGLVSQTAELKYLLRVRDFLTVPADFEADRVRVRLVDKAARAADTEFETQWVLTQE